MGRPVIDATRDLFARRQRELTREWEQAVGIADRLRIDARDRFEAIALRLRQAAPTAQHSGRVRILSPPPGREIIFFRWQIVQAANDLDYFANTAPDQRAWSRLILVTEGAAEILVSFHGLGREFRGVLAASMCFFRREETEGGDRETADFVTAVDEDFQINYLDDAEQARDRFHEWLERGLVRALEVWRVRL